MPLDEALDRALKAYDKDRLHEAPVDIVAQHIGYKSANNGTALQAIASLRYYGLLVRPKDGFLAVSKDVEAYRFAPDESGRSALLAKFLKAPSLFAELLDKYEQGLPSEATLKYDLIQKGFIPSAAENVLAAFRRSVAFVGYYEGREGQREIGESTEAGPTDDPAPEESRSQDSPSRNLERERPSMATDVDESSDRIPVRLPGARRAWLSIPAPFFSADKARLKAQIDLLLTEDEDSE
jgi:hypothetical protein